MYDQIMKKIPDMLSGNELMDALRVRPEYDPNIVHGTVPERLMAMSNLYNIYEPSEQMSVQIYSKLYLGLLRSLQKKGTRMALRQQLENRQAVLGADYNSVLGGCDSFTIIGESGIGKSRSVSRAISIMQGEKIIVTDQPYLKLLPVCSVQCPYDSSVKGMLLEILRKIDEALGSRYHESALRARMTADMLIGSVSQACLNHIGLLIVDEIQNVVSNKNGRNLVGALTQLINNSGISIGMVGTPESAVFFESEMYMARRSLGLQFDPMQYDENFRNLCRTLLSYRYVGGPFDITEGMLRWLHEHCGGNISVLISLIHDAQENAIINGTEQFDMNALNAAYDRNLSFLHDYIRREEPIVLPRPKKQRVVVSAEKGMTVNRINIEETVRRAKNKGSDVLQTIGAIITVEEVAV